MQSRDKVNITENLNKAMIQRTKNSCVRILLYIKNYIVFSFLS